MAFTRPTLQELVTRVSGDFRARLTLNGSLLRRAFVYVMARVYAGVAHLLYGYLDYIAKQMFTETMDDENVSREADMYGLSKIAATFAAGEVTFTGVDESEIIAETPLIRADGVRYLTDAPATIDDGEATVSVTCVTAGITGNADAGTALSLESPIAGVDASGVVGEDGLAGGFDQESTDSLRARVRERKQAQPTGGSIDDYKRWVKEVTGQTRVWVYRGEMGAGAVTIRFVLDMNADDIIPPGPTVEAVQENVDAKAPVVGTNYVVAPIPDALDITLSITPDTPDIRAAVEAELQDLIRRDAEPGGTILFSHLNEAVSDATGEEDHVITIPAGNVAHGTGHMAVLGTVTFT